MVLISIRYNRLKRLLKVQEKVGASFYNLRFLDAIKDSISITIMDGDMDVLHHHLHQGHPVIVSIDTRALPYWEHEDEMAYHAVVVAAMDEATVSVYDPWFTEAPKVVEKLTFESAWLYREYAMAVIETTGN